jgi:hypothetical protein
MSWVYEIALRGAQPASEALRDWLESGPRQALAALPGLSSLDLYTPAEGAPQDPYNRDTGGPLMMLMVDFVSRDALASAVSGGAIEAALGPLPSGVAATGAAFERRLYPIGEVTTPAPLRAPFSYVVRYHRPADDEPAFIANYLATHPGTQAKLPAIRTIICYVPVDELQSRGGSLAAADYMIGNEVVFDDIAAFNVAMASPVRQELRAHYREFPRFTGANTHHAMTRTRLTG